MKIKTYLFSAFFVSVSLFSFAQDTYVRPSVSLVNIDFSNSRSSLNLSTVEVPANLDHVNLSMNRFATSSISPNAKDNADALASKEDAILKSFINNRVSNAGIMAVTPILDGQYDYSSVLDRGVNSATDQDVNITSQNMVGDLGNEQDQFLYIAEQILDRNYVLAFNKGGVSSYSDKYSVGFQGDIRYYLFKINSIYSPDDGDMMVSAQDLPQAQIDATIASSGSFTTTATNSKEQVLGKPKSDSELKKELTKSLLQLVWDDLLMKVDEFQPKTTLLAKKQISLGTKENLKIDNRFFAFENVESKDGQIIQKKRATLRVKSVANNDGKATGDGPKSKLYKIGYGSAKEGMLIQQKEDLGIGIGVGYGTLSWIKIDYRLKGITPGLLVFAEINPYPGNVEFVDDLYYAGTIPFDGAFTALAFNAYVGAEKMMYFSPVFYLSPFVGGGMSKIMLTGSPFSDYTAYGYTVPLSDYQWSDEENSIYDAYLADLGVRAGFHLSSSLSANLSLAYVIPIVGGYVDPDIVDADGDYVTTVSGFNEGLLEKKPAIPDGMQFSIMVRYEF